jgi:hypothetical protein
VLKTKQAKNAFGEKGKFRDCFGYMPRFLSNLDVILISMGISDMIL